MNSRQHHVRAVLYALAGVTCWVFGDTFMKLASGPNIAKYEIMSLAGLSGMAVVFLFARLRGDKHALRLKRYRGLIAISFCSTIGFACWLTGLPRMPLADYYTIIFLSPTVVAILAALFLAEPVGWKKGLAILAGFLGVIVAVDPLSRTNAGDFIGYAAVFIGMLALSVQMLLVRFFGRHESREAIAFYPRIAAILAGLIVGVIEGFTPMPAQNVIYSLIYGSFGGAGWLFIAQAYRHAPAATVAPFQYSQIITGGIIGYLIWHEIPSMHLVIGTVIIIASGLYIAAHGHAVKPEIEET